MTNFVFDRGLETHTVSNAFKRCESISIHIFILYYIMLHYNLLNIYVSKYAILYILYI